MSVPPPERRWAASRVVAASVESDSIATVTTPWLSTASRAAVSEPVPPRKVDESSCPSSGECLPSQMPELYVAPAKMVPLSLSRDRTGWAKGMVVDKLQVVPESREMKTAPVFVPATM